jgi:hypothetical protein
MVEVMVTRVTGPVTGKITMVEVIHRIENIADGIGLKGWRNQAEYFNYFAS